MTNAPFIAARDAQPCRGLVLNVPDFFADAAFRCWLEDGTSKFTWHRDGEIGEWSDVVVLVDPSLSGEGSDSDMPAAMWDQIVEMCRQHLGPCRDEHHYMIRLANFSS